MGRTEYSNLTKIETVDDLEELIHVINNQNLAEFQYLVDGDEWSVSVK